jgi:hypothetical protein
MKNTQARRASEGDSERHPSKWSPRWRVELVWETH